MQVEMTREEAELLRDKANYEAGLLWKEGLRSPKRTLGGQMRVMYLSAASKLIAALAADTEPEGKQRG